MIKTDVIIVGGGPAGSACARRLQQRNISCLILDQESFPRIKPCAGWVTPQVFKLLQLSPENYPFGLTTFTSFNISLRGIKFRLPTHQYAIRRVEFDAWLLKQANVECIQHKVKEINKNDDGYLIDGKFFAKYLVGGGGTHCPVQRSFFTRNRSDQDQGLIIAKEEEFLYPYSDNRCHLWFFDNGLPGYAWYVPKAEGYLNVGIGGSAARLKTKGESLNDHWERLMIKIAQSGLVVNHSFKPQGYSYYLRQQHSQIQNGHALIIGDALGLATKDMGEGIGPAIQSGFLAADAISLGLDYSITSIPRYSFPSLIRLRGW